MPSDIPDKIPVRPISAIIADVLPKPNERVIEPISISDTEHLIIRADIGWFELIHAWAFYRLQAHVKQYMEGQANMGDKGILDSLKGYIIPVIVRWLLKIGGGWLLAVGVSSDDVTTIVAAVISIVAGIVTTLINHKKAVNTPV